MKKAIPSSETTVLTRATRRNIPENDILHVIPCMYVYICKGWAKNHTSLHCDPQDLLYPSNPITTNF
jgi:hypothetical protein